jgi:hypothetical protein
MAKAGRKPKNNEDKTTSITLTIPKELKKKLKQLKEEGIKFNKSSFFAEKVLEKLSEFNK